MLVNHEKHNGVYQKYAQLPLTARPLDLLYFVFFAVSFLHLADTLLHPDFYPSFSSFVPTALNTSSNPLASWPNVAVMTDSPPGLSYYWYAMDLSTTTRPLLLARPAWFLRWPIAGSTHRRSRRSFWRQRSSSLVQNIYCARSVRAMLRIPHLIPTYARFWRHSVFQIPVFILGLRALQKGKDGHFLAYQLCQ